MKRIRPNKLVSNRLPVAITAINSSETSSFYKHHSLSFTSFLSNSINVCDINDSTIIYNEEFSTIQLPK